MVPGAFVMHGRFYRIAGWGERRHDGTEHTEAADL
jgi:hypothetical protein